eukprot:m51a1_g9759 hypothetical protein (799) ;mRNA; r:1616317-1619273
MESAHIPLLLLLLGAAVQVASGQSACEGGEAYDATGPAYAWGSVRIYNTYADSKALCAGTPASPCPCPPSTVPVTSPAEMAEATWAMLFTPPEVPYKYESVCLNLLGLNTVANVSALSPAERALAVFEVHGEVVIWSVVADRQSNYLRPNQKRASYPFRAAWPMAETAQSHWVTVNFTRPSLPMSTTAPPVAWEKGVYLGLNYWSCRKVSMSTMKDPSRPIRLVWNADNYVWKQVYGVASSSGVTRAIVLRAKGHKYDWKTEGIPPTWTLCPDSQYGDGVCNCECGAWDIDCLHNQSSPDCKNSEICDQTGFCVTMPWKSSSGCRAENYWAYDGCQCECGGISDPDCWDLYQNVSVCSTRFSSPICKMNTSSAAALPAYCKESWSCPEDRYADGKVCDCECGALDPDCSNTRLPTSCHDGFQCISGTCAVPAGWNIVKCPISDYNTGGTCSCNCGVYDPDCDKTNRVGNCQGVQTCSYQGTCIDPGCGNNRTEEFGTPSEQCDGGYGCDAQCQCLPGYSPTSPRRQGCVEVCGDSIVVGDEQCDKGLFCNASTCQCVPGHYPYAARQGFCTGCGNGVLDAAHNESCDGGDGCDAECHCLQGWQETVPRSAICTRPAESRRTLIISTSVGGGVAAILLSVVVGAFIYARKVKYGPRPLNIPIDVALPQTFVDAAVIEQNVVASISSAQSAQVGTGTGTGTSDSGGPNSSGSGSGGIMAALNAEGLVYLSGMPVDHGGVGTDIAYVTAGGVPMQVLQSPSDPTASSVPVMSTGSMTVPLSGPYYDPATGAPMSVHDPGEQ